MIRCVLRFTRTKVHMLTPEALRASQRVYEMSFTSAGAPLAPSSPSEAEEAYVAGQLRLVRREDDHQALSSFY
jgi:hypothetical protein